MAFKFNPFTGTLDQTGSGGGASYIDGEVQNFSALPETIGTPAVDSAYLVREAEGTWLLARKPAGIYIRTADTGVRVDDWTHAGAFPDVFNDANFLLYDNSDSTKNLAFQLSGLTTGTVRTLTAPDASGTIALTSDFAAPPAIGSTTPNSAAFTGLSANNGTLTASAPVLDLAQTWNNAAVAFTAINLDITNTASAFGSQFLQFSIAGVPQVRFQRNFSTPVLYFGNSDTGIGSSSTTLSVYANGGATASFGAGGGGMNLRSDSPYSWASSTNLTSANDLSLFRDAADTLAQRRTTNPQTFRIYNTYINASNHERGFMRWSSNVLQIGTEKAGTGSARSVEFHYDGTAAFRVFPQGINVRAAGMLGFASNGITGVDVALDRPSAGVIRIGDNSTNNPPALRIHNQLGSTEYAALRWASNEFIFDANAGSGTLRGIKLGSASTSLLGFFGATPVDQQAAVADATDAATAITQLNDLLAAMRTLGLIAT
jgi:hypothetical protein